MMFDAAALDLRAGKDFFLTVDQELGDLAFEQPRLVRRAPHRAEPAHEPAQAEALATSTAEHPFHVAGLVVELSLRVGVAVSPEHGETAATLFQRAEIALREAQRNHSRAALAVAAPDSGGRQLVLAHELQRAVEAEDFCVFVQPKRVLTDDLVTAVEVLVRWIKDDGTFFQPDDFIPIAERTGLIRPLTSLVLRKALEQRRQWVAAGYDIDLAVNASVRDLVDPAFPEQVAVALTRAVCPPSALTLAGYLLGRTSTIHVGTAVTILPLHSPVHVAEQVALLDVVSGGRFRFGAGRAGPHAA